MVNSWYWTITKQKRELAFILDKIDQVFCYEYKIRKQQRNNHRNKCWKHIRVLPIYLYVLSEQKAIVMFLKPNYLCKKTLVEKGSFLADIN